MLLLSTIILSLLAVLSEGAGSTYNIGVGRYDVTGPAAEVEMMGYASPTQIGKGIHLRQFSRAFVIGDEYGHRVVFVNADICMGTQIVKMQVVEKLQSLYGKLYTHENVLISAIHTHSGPAGYFQYVLYEVMSLGFVGQSLEAIVDGIVESIKLAHASMQKGTISYAVGSVDDANINRSPSAYLNNPKAERDKYTSDTDKTMVVLKMVNEEGKDLGMLDWFAVHCTSMNNTNQLISSDNKGFASLMMEKAMNGPDTLPGMGSFVAAFAQSNEGDVSPNTKGPHCTDSREKCDFYHSTCHGKNELCVSPGPGKDMLDSTRIIATKQYDEGKKLYEGTTTPVNGEVSFIYSNMDFGNTTVGENFTCLPAMGRSFAAGTTDGPGAFNFEQGDNSSSNPFWNFVRDLLKAPSKEQVACHHPKPILLDTGEMNFPYPWEPKIMPVQILRIGQFVIVGVPGEFTTMAGRRTRDAVKKALTSNGYPDDTIVVIAGLSNTYAGYVTTFEEYMVQRYEGASTAFGPYTLQAYIQQFTKMAVALATKGQVDPGPPFPNYLEKQIGFHLPVVFDATPSGKDFGSVKTDVKANLTYQANQSVQVEFWSGNPRNNLMTNKTFLTVELKDSTGKWKVRYTDASWETKFEWEQTSTILGQSVATVTWDIPPDVAAGTYRIQHFGYHKSILSDPKPFSGMTSEFKVTN